MQRSVLTSFVIAVVVCLQPVSHASDEKTSADREQYELMKLFVETYSQIETNYVQDIDRRELMEAAIQGMLDHLDQYSSYIPPSDLRRFNQTMEQEFGGIGIHVTVPRRGGNPVVMSPLPGGPAYRAGIRAGDIILEVEGESTEGFTIPDAVKRLQGPAGRPVTLTVKHRNVEEPEEIRIVRQVIQVPTVLGDRYSANNEWDFMYSAEEKIGYIRLSHFSRLTAQEVQETVAKLVDDGLRGLVVDLRSNPGGLLEAAIEIADLFLESGEIVSVRGRNVPENSWKAKKPGTFPDFPMAVIVNRFSASASEVLSACLQDNQRAKIVGERTWGKGSVQNVIRIEDGDSALKLTTASYHRPNGVNIHRMKGASDSDDWGVTPDEGFQIRFTDEEMTAWSIDRRRRDILQDEPETSEPFTDRQFLAALDEVRKQLDSAAGTPDANVGPPGTE